MKKIFSLLLAGMMVASLAVMPVAAEAPAQQTNVDVEVLAMATAPTFDGVINADEWGDPSFHAKGEDAASVGATAYSATNTFVYGDCNDQKGNADRMDMKMWYRWDNDYLYIAVDVLDDNGYFCESGRGDMWSEDVLQFFIDPVGPNGVAKANDPTYDYKTTGFDWKEYTRPWSAENGIPNITAGYVSSVTRQAYQLYNANDQLMIASATADGNLNPVGDYSTAGKFMMTPATAENHRTVYEMAIPWEVISYDADVVIDAESNSSKQFGVGKVLGLSMMYQNINEDGFSQDSDDDTDDAGAPLNPPNQMSTICWGSGIPGFQHEIKYDGDLGYENADYHFINGGSNALTLVSKGIDGNEVAGLVTWDSEAAEIEFAEQAMYGAAGQPYMHNGKAEANGEFYVEMDIAMLDWAVTDPTHTAAGFVFGSDFVLTSEAGSNKTAGDFDQFSVMAGYDYSTQTFKIGEWGTEDGFMPQVGDAADENEAKREDGYNIWAESEVINWAVGDYENETAAEWGRMGLQVSGDTATLYFNGDKVLEYTTPAIEVAEDGTITGGQYGEGVSIISGSNVKPGSEEPVGLSPICYITGERLMDNYIFGNGSDYVFGSQATAKCADLTFHYTFDTTDTKYFVSPLYSLYANEYPLVTVACNDVESDYHVGHNTGVLAATEVHIMTGCHFCDEFTDYDFNNDGAYAPHNENRIPADAPLPDPEPGPGPDVLVGDVDGSGEVDNKDAAKLIRLVAGFENSGVAEGAVIDFNDDGETTNKDIALLLRYIAGLITEL